MATVLHALASYVESMLTEMATDEVGMLLGVPIEIDEMGVKLGDIKNFLADAEERCITDMSVQRWVTELKRAMYEATDILDLCHLKAMEQPDPSATNVGCCNPLFFCLRNPLHAHDIGIRIKTLNQKLDAIKERSAAFSFINLGWGDYRDRNRIKSAGRETTSVLERSGLVGEKIEEDARDLGKLLTEPGENNDDIMVVAIVGAVGIGKTTLANYIYNSNVIRWHFEKRIWLSVTQEYSPIHLLKMAILQADGHLPAGDGAEDMSLLARSLAGAIGGKKVFLVLDDLWLWSHEAWIGSLRATLSNGNPGSRVLITTRNDQVARMMKAVRPYHRVSKLGPEEAWSLLKKQVVLSNTDETEFDMLKDIGLKIIAKCDGLPLAVKVMSGLLMQTGRERRDWERLLNNTIWSASEMPEVLKDSIYLSYQDLSACLKQCFLHCSLLPKNRVFYEDDIVGMWISEGILHGNSSHELEEIGRMYYSELISRNLLDIDGRCTSQRVCDMNDVVRSFALFMCRDEALVAQNGDRSMISKLTSQMFFRLSLDSKGFESDMLDRRSLTEQKSLRTLILVGPIELKVDSLLAFPTLRTLHIESANAAVLVSLCQLKHLRYLSFAHTDVSRLPENIGRMKLLQHINLHGCKSLVKLPDSIIKLRNLRYLNLDGTSIICIPPGFRDLTNLRKLYGFPAHMDGNWCSLDELGPLSKLNAVVLKGLENIPSTWSAAEARLGEKDLTYLKLGSSTRLGDDGRLVKEGDENEAIEEVFDELSPNICHTLEIQGYFGRRLPRWMTAMRGNLDRLVVLTMEELVFCTDLPDGLCQLPCLMVLKIRWAPAIKFVGPKFLGLDRHSTHTATVFPRLHELVLFGMVEWEEWEWEEQVNVQVMPFMEELLLNSCKLRRVPPGLAFHARALRQLVITAAANLRSLDGFASVVELHVCSSPKLTRIANLPKLQKLKIVMCPKLKELTGVPAIRRLALEDCDYMKTLPGYLQDLPLSHLQLDCTLELLRFIAAGMSGPERSKFSHVDHVEAYARDGNNPKAWYVLYTREPYYLETNIMLPDEEELHARDDDLVGTDNSSESALVAIPDGEELLGRSNSSISEVALISDVALSNEELVGTSNSSVSKEALNKDDDEFLFFFGKDDDDDELIDTGNSSGSKVALSNDELVGTSISKVALSNDEPVGTSNSSVSKVALNNDDDDLVGIDNSSGSKVVLPNNDELIGTGNSSGSKVVLPVGKRNSSESAVVLPSKDYSTTLVGKDNPSWSATATLWNNNLKLFGIDTVLQDLEEMMNANDTQLKVVSIYGTGGVGKTAIAKAIGRKTAKEFNHQAFISVGSHNPDKNEIIGSIFNQLHYLRPAIQEWSDEKIIEELKKILQQKRSLIVVDDIWDVSVILDLIKPCLIDSNNGSRIITTTRDVRVAKQVGHVYYLPLLSDNYSKKLFYGRTYFRSETGCPSELMESCHKLLSKCDGLPLAIIAITSLLPSELDLAKWVEVCNSGVSGLKVDKRVKDMRTTLRRSYDNLSSRELKTCALYLSVFRDGHKFRRDQLVQRWIAEDLISMQRGQELGDEYFCELVNMSIIQPIEFDCFGQALVYRVPVPILDLAADLSIEEKSDTIISARKERIVLQDKAERLSHQGSNEQDVVPITTKTFRQVSSLMSIFRGSDLMPFSSRSKGLRVLDLEKCDFLKNGDLNGITNLVRLKYLIIGGSHVTAIPKKIGNLQHLQTLDLTATSVKELPSSVLELTELRHLLINRSTKVPAGIERLHALEELVDIDVSMSPSILEDVISLPKLRVLSIALWSWDERHSILLPEKLSKLITRKLKHLSIFTCCSLDFKADVQLVFQQLEKLEIQGSTFDKLPVWISKLSNLRSLCIEVFSLEAKSLLTIGSQLSNLLFLSLTAKKIIGEKLVLGADDFCSLESFLLFNRAIAITFNKGAMKSLQWLGLTVQASLAEEYFCFGLENLSCLRHVKVEIICSGATDEMVTKVESDIRSMIGTNPNYPKSDIEKTMEDYKIEGKKKEADCEIKVEGEKEADSWKQMVDKRCNEVWVANHGAVRERRLMMGGAAHNQDNLSLPAYAERWSRNNDGQSFPQFKAYALANKSKAKQGVNYDPNDPAEAYYNPNVKARLDGYSSMAREIHGDEYDPSEHDLDPEVVMRAGGGKKHGWFWLGDNTLDTTSTSSLSQIRARSSSSSPSIRPCPEPTRIAMMKLQAQLDEERRLREESKKRQEERLEERMAEMIAAERQAFEESRATDRAVFHEQIKTVFAILGQSLPPMPPMQSPPPLLLRAPYTPHASARSNELGGGSSHVSPNNPCGTPP